MLKLLGYSLPETETPGKYELWPTKPTKPTNEPDITYLTSYLAEEPDLQMHLDSTSMTFLLLHRKVKGIDSKFEIIEVGDQKHLKLSHGSKEIDVEISEFPDGNLKMEKAFLEVSEFMLGKWGYLKKWEQERYYMETEQYVCTVKSTQEGEPDLAYYKNQSMLDLLESNSRMTTRMKRTSERKNAPRCIKQLNPEDQSRWVHFFYAGKEFEKKVRDKTEPYKEEEEQQVKQECVQMALESLGYDVSGIPKEHHDYLYGLKNQKKEKIPEGPIYINSKDPDLPELTILLPINVHKYLLHLVKLCRILKVKYPDFKKILHAEGCGFELVHGGKKYREFASFWPEPSEEEVDNAKNRLARKALLSMGYKFPRWTEGEVFQEVSSEVWVEDRPHPMMRGGPMHGGPIHGGPMRGHPMRGHPMRGHPMRGGPMPRGPWRGGPMPRGPWRGGPMRGGPMGGPRRGGPMPPWMRGGPMRGRGMYGGPMGARPMEGESMGDVEEPSEAKRPRIEAPPTAFRGSAYRKSPEPPASADNSTSQQHEEAPATAFKGSAYQQSTETAFKGSAYQQSTETLTDASNGTGYGQVDASYGTGYGQADASYGTGYGQADASYGTGYGQAPAVSAFKGSAYQQSTETAFKGSAYQQSTETAFKASAYQQSTETLTDSSDGTGYGQADASNDGTGFGQAPAGSVSRDQFPDVFKGGSYVKSYSY